MSEDSGPDYCNICENFPCLGGHPPDAAEEERERYETALAYLRCGVVSRPEAERLWGLPPGFPDRVAEERDRQEWTEGTRRRLGLVAEVHRCLVRGPRPWAPWPGWGWVCLRPDCPAGNIHSPSQDAAFPEALAHARSFIPEPPREEPVTELDLAVFDGFQCGTSRRYSR